jgi:hypothetical protein
MGKRQSYAYSQDGGANDEGEDDSQNNYGVWINGRMWKVFATQHSANAVARSLQAKGKDAKVGLTAAPVSEQGIAEALASKIAQVQEMINTVKESATAGATSSGNIATVPNPHLSPGKARGKKSYTGSPTTGSGTKAPPQPKPASNTGKNALDMKGTSVFGGPAIKR